MSAHHRARVRYRDKAAAKLFSRFFFFRDSSGSSAVEAFFQGQLGGEDEKWWEKRLKKV